MENKYAVIMVACANKTEAKKIAELLVNMRLAACVQMMPIESVYVWQNEVCSGSEVLLLVKSKANLFDKIAETITKHHSYDVPEIVQVPIINGLPSYLSWIDDCVD